MAAGERAALIFCVQRGDAEAVAAAREVDAAYADALARAAGAGLELYALQARIEPPIIAPHRSLPVRVNP